jgi:hypothetical protein
MSQKLRGRDISEITIIFSIIVGVLRAGKSCWVLKGSVVLSVAIGVGWE